jgi:hypothetical protein
MANPIQVNKAEFEKFPGARWNAMIEICSMMDIRDLTPVQRVAHLAFWYMSEVYNGGHYQYFVNKSGINHREVIAALQTIGAGEQASILSNACNTIGTNRLEMPQDVEEYLSNEKAIDLSDFDTQFYNSQRSIETCLQGYLDKHESEFVEWKL